MDTTLFATTHLAAPTNSTFVVQPIKCKYVKMAGHKRYFSDFMEHLAGKPAALTYRSTSASTREEALALFKDQEHKDLLPAFSPESREEVYRQLGIMVSITEYKDGYSIPPAVTQVYLNAPVTKKAVKKAAKSEKILRDQDWPFPKAPAEQETAAVHIG